jgi:CheY-like chemotaxis protein
VSESILVADDSLLVRESIQAALRERGARVELACDGEEARSRLRELAPDLLLADVHMPGLDGYALCREAKTERAATRVVLLVGTFEPYDSSAASFARADGVLRKPFVADELLRKVEELLGPVRAPEPPRHAEPEAPEPLTHTPVSAGAEATETAVSSEVETRVELSDADVDRIARRVLEIGGGAVLERIAREMLGARGRRGDPERE